MTLLYQNKMKAGFIMLCVLYSLTTVVSPSTGGRYEIFISSTN